jgi:hypothetical protein
MKRVALIVLLSITAAIAANKDKRFSVGRASSYAGHQTSEKITIAAIPYTSAEQAATAFGKVKPYEHGILPVLVVIDNDTGKALRLNLKAQFIDSGGEHVEAIAPEDVLTYHAITKRPGQPRVSPWPPIARAQSTKKGPLNTPEIVDRAFSIHLVPPGESVYGFFYFEANHLPGDKIYLDGLSDATTGNEYLFFEVPVVK